LELANGGSDVELAATGQKELARGRISTQLKRRILFHESAQRAENFILVAL
jgi:hypothetical protein